MVLGSRTGSSSSAFQHTEQQHVKRDDDDGSDRDFPIVPPVLLLHDLRFCSGFQRLPAVLSTVPGALVFPFAVDVPGVYGQFWDFGETNGINGHPRVSTRRPGNWSGTVPEPFTCEDSMSFGRCLRWIISDRFVARPETGTGGVGGLTDI